MNTTQLFTLSGLAAVAGGLLRIAVAFPVIGDEITLQWLYTGIDMLLTFGIIGIYLDRAKRLRFLGFTSFVIAVAALSFIGGPDADPFGFSTYEQGAVTLAIALVGLSIAWISAGERPIFAPLCWFASVVAAGALGLSPATEPYGFLVAGVLFGLGFVLAGYDLARRGSVAAGDA